MKKLDEVLNRLGKHIRAREAAAAQAEGRPAATVTPIKDRMIQSSVQIMGKSANDFLFQHTLFCQTVLPYRDPGPDVRIWEREQGKISLRIEAGYIKSLTGTGYVPIGLPFGPAARLILCHLNTEALRRATPLYQIALKKYFMLLESY